MSLAILTTTIAMTVALNPSQTEPVVQSSFAPLTTSGGAAPITWEIVSGSLPDGITLDNAGTCLLGSPTQRGTALVTLRATDSTSPIPLFTDAVCTITIT